MSKLLAVRNIRLCTKDCLCLYVCPTGATDTENSVIDPRKCTGCGACAGACPSGAISMVPLEYPPQQPKADGVKEALGALSRSKARQEKLALELLEAAGDKDLDRLARAAAMSNRLMGEDILRESGYLLPQSAAVRELLQDLLANPPAGLPREAAEELVHRLPGV